MKRIILTIGAFAIMAGAHCQSIYDANRLVGNDLNGTARFVGMGGAMGALGGDISTMGTNPAGIGIYRSNDIMTSFGFNYTGVESNHRGNVLDDNRTRMSFDNIGFVYSNKIGNKTALRYVNFGFNYHKSKNFNRSMLMSGNFDASQSDQMASLSNRRVSSQFPWGVVDPEDFLSTNAFLNPDIPWLGIFGYEALLINPYQKDDRTDEYLGYLPFDNTTINGRFQSQESGGIDSYDFNLAFNVYDQVYIGATFGVHHVDYNLRTSYGETFYINGEDNGNYTLNSRLKTFGTGLDFKLGIIVRPSLDLPLRIGAAVHTPTYYRITDRNFAWIEYDTKDLNGDYFASTLASQDEYGEELSLDTDYRVRTPWKFNFSLGYTVGNYLALGAEYEFADHSSTNMRLDYNGFTESMTEENAAMKEMLKGVHTIRLGMEARLVPEFSVRAGYNHITAAFDKAAYKDLPLNSVRTDTDYTNDYSKNNITLGMGYKKRSFYADLAYQYSFYKSDFYAFKAPASNLAATQLNNDRHQVLMTLGFRF